MNRLLVALQGAAVWVFRLFLLQLLWALQVLAGGVLLGVAPATNVLAGQIAKYLHSEDAPFEWRAAWRLWRGEFRRMQILLGVPMLHAVLIALCLWLARGTFFALPTAILALAFAVWLQHLPCAILRRADGDGAFIVWFEGLRLVARSPLRALVATSATVAAIVLAVLYSPAALLAFGVSAPALAAGLAAKDRRLTLRRGQRGQLGLRS